MAHFSFAQPVCARFATECIIFVVYLLDWGYWLTFSWPSGRYICCMKWLLGPYWSLGL